MFVIENEGKYYRYMPVGAFDSANWTSDLTKAYWFDTYEEADDIAKAIYDVLGDSINIYNEDNELCWG